MTMYCQLLLVANTKVLFKTRRKLEHDNVLSIIISCKHKRLANVIRLLIILVLVWPKDVQQDPLVGCCLRYASVSTCWDVSSHTQDVVIAAIRSFLPLWVSSSLSFSISWCFHSSHWSSNSELEDQPQLKSIVELN
ncbi:hypothetical protein PRUPE_6G218000 [Prunus persica]|uniref:Uncharacterized protein n=1 Tax=Prunus persica TaxID=3760 RepID=A0A251NTV0_PRUPE|nr:hypothetical protein PRUPE_6G218000 [Prunus persica]